MCFADLGTGEIMLGSDPIVPLAKNNFKSLDVENMPIRVIKAPPIDLDASILVRMITKLGNKLKIASDTYTKPMELPMLTGNSG
jgi:hypothetical protein